MIAPATATLEPSTGSRPAKRPVRRVLMLAHRLPYPPDRGDRIRSYQLLKLLSRHFELDVACTSEDPVWLQHHQLLSTMAKRVHIQPISPSYTRVRGVQAIFTGDAITPASFFRQSLADVILQWHDQKPIDAVLTYCTGMIDYARVLTTNKRTNPVPHHVLDLVDVDSVKWETYAQNTLPPMKWVYQIESNRLRRIERGEFDHFDAVTVVSANEAQAYRAHVGNHAGLTVVGNGVDVDYFHTLEEPPPSEPPTLCFVGVLNYKPNAAGVDWFVRQVMPQLRQRVPNVRFMIVGRHPTQAVQELGRFPGVDIIGSVPDVRTYMQQASVIIAPLLIARGVQNKVLEAMACQRPVVCSPGAAQGIDATPGEHMLVADEPTQWVDTLCKLFNDASLRRTIATAARQHVLTHYAWEDRLSPMVRLLKGEQVES